MAFWKVYSRANSETKARPQQLVMQSSPRPAHSPSLPVPQLESPMEREHFTLFFSPVLFFVDMFLSLVRQETLDQQQRKPSTLSQASPCSKPIPGYLFPAIFSLVTQDMIKGDGFPPRNFIQLKRKHYRLWLKPKFTQPFEF